MSAIPLGPLAALSSSLTWAFGSTMYAREARRTSAIEVNLTRAVVVLPLFWLGAALTGAAGSALPRLDGARLGWLAASTLCSYGVGDLLFYLAAARLGTPTALAISSAFPLWAALAGVLTLGERLPLPRAAGMVLCVAGVIWLVLLSRGTGEARRGARPTAGLLLAFLTSLCWAGNTYCTRRGAAGLPLLFANAVRYSIALAVLLPPLLWQRRRAPGGQRLLGATRQMLPFTGVCFVEAFCGSSLFVYGLGHSDLAVATTLSALAPLFAVPIGMALGTERLGLRRCCAIALTVGGVALLVSF